MTKPQSTAAAMPSDSPTRAPEPRFTGSAGFWSLIVTQFQGAFSDNALKNLVVFLILANLPQQERNQWVAVAGALFALPFIFFSMAGGFLADRYSKRSVTIATKVMEIAVMSVALAGLGLGDLRVQMAAIFLLSTQAALFGPSKYGLLPELLPEKKLSWGNGILEMGTFFAIISGTVAAGFLFEKFRGAQQWSGISLIAISCVGLAASFGISRVPAANPGRKFRMNFIGEVWEQILELKNDQALQLAVVGNSYFFFLGALLFSNIVVFSKEVLHVSETHGSLLMAATAVGIGVGSLVAGFISSNKIELGLIPLGSIGMTVCGALLYRTTLSFEGTALLLSLLGFFSGFFIVPISAMIQHRPDPARKGGVIATANLLSFVGVFIAAAVYFLLTARVVVRGHTLWNLGFTPGGVFFASGIFSLIATLYVVKLLPQAMLRLMFFFATHTLYRIRVEGRDNIPAKGGALFVSNHLSFVDAMLLQAATDRNVRFMMFKDIYDFPFIKPFAMLMKAIPISSNLRPRDMIRSLRAASDSIQAGRVVCIFAEGQITRIGHLLPFRRGMERIMKGVDAPIIPVHLDGVWGSIFSFERGRFFWKIPHRVPWSVTVSFGKPMPPTSSAVEVRCRVQELETAAFRHQKARMETVHRAFVRTARMHPFRFAMADARVPHLRYGSALAKTIFLAHRLEKVWKGQKNVGILLPPSVGGALTNYAAMMMGKVSVNFNYTASNEIIAACAAQSGVQTTVTSRAFLERLPHLVVPGKTVILEDLVENPRLIEKLIALVMAVTFPFEALEKALGAEHLTKLDDLVTIIFSSGSTGNPKGVMLSHYNVASNVDQMGRTFAPRKKDHLMGILPFFHSFGYTATLCLPIMLGNGAIFYPNPLDSVTIGEMVRKYSATFLLATPTFLQAFIRRVAPEDFGSLQFVLVGAEKLPERVSQAFEDTFGVKPLEGYGCTECSPVVAVNVHDFRAPGFRQVGLKRGKIGHPLPGISVRILDPETRKELPLGTPGLMMVKGPNVMVGYLNAPEKTAEVVEDGWYNTGDIAMLDEDGFITITDRLSRFSKIGGEMVPHIKVEEKLHECAGSGEQVFAVTGVPDGKKGERLIVLHTLTEPKLLEALERFSAAQLPSLWRPKPNQFVRIENMPFLGTGKLDLRRLKELALELSGQIN